MTNYERITKLLPGGLADFLDGFNPDRIIDWYCGGKCDRKSKGECPLDLPRIEHVDCPVTRTEMIKRWLNEENKGKEVPKV